MLLHVLSAHLYGADIIQFSKVKQFSFDEEHEPSGHTYEYILQEIEEHYEAFDKHVEPHINGAVELHYEGQI